MNRSYVAKELVWPEVAWPAVPSVYVDLNHYIYMARTLDGDRTAPTGYDALFAQLCRAVDGGRIVVPLSTVHLAELAGIEDPKQRRAVASVMERVSGFRYVLGRPLIARLEIGAGMRAVSSEATSGDPISLINPGFGWAFGRPMTPTIKHKVTGQDVTIQARQQMGAELFDHFMREAVYMTERAMLDGPSDEDLPSLRNAYGYAPEAAQQGHQSRLDFELELVELLHREPKWRSGRLRDVVSAREVVYEWLDAIEEARRSRIIGGLDIVEFDQPMFLAFCAGMPHVQVAISIKTRYHRNPNHKWSTNDIHDIDALSVAYAYCDAVFTDKAARSAFIDSADLRQFRTFAPRRVAELTAWLADDAFGGYDLLWRGRPRAAGYANR
jgi:hypothetical protein